MTLCVCGLLTGPVPGRAQNAPYATSTRTEQGLAWGAAIGGALGGLSFGVLSVGLCDAADCGGSFAEGFFPGVLVGAVGGGLTGMVVGAAIPEDGPARGGWSWGVRAGVGGPRDRDVSGLGLLGDVHGLRAITDRTHFGIAVEYLGSSRRSLSYTLRLGDGTSEARTEVRNVRVTGVRLVAARLLGTTARSGGYVEGRVGLHPTWERSTHSAPERGFSSTNHSFVLAPGGGVGVGGLVPLSPSWSLEVEGRADVIIGIGSDGVVPVAQLALGLRKIG